MKRYFANRRLFGTDVIVEPPQGLRYSLPARSLYGPPGRFDWGYNGYRAHCLAFAILADHFGDEEPARRFFPFFWHSYLAQRRPYGFLLTAEEIEANLPPYCRKCFCTEDDACWNEEVGPCWWVEADLCSHCKYETTETLIEGQQKVLQEFQVEDL